MSSKVVTSHVLRLTSVKENGIFHRSLLKRRLLGLQVAVCKDKNNLLDVYETYTISIDYSGRRGPSEPKVPREKDRAKMDFQDPKEDYLSSLQVKEGIMAMFRKLSILTSRLSALPGTTYHVHSRNGPI